MIALALVLAGLGVGSIFFFQPRPILEMVAGHSPEVLYYVRTDEKVIALTIDDGPHREVTPGILDKLAEHGARATFFLIGERTRGNHDLLDRMRNEGHELANHMYSDCPSIRLSESEFERQLVEVDKILFPKPVKGKWFRPGSGWFNGRMLRQIEAHGYRCCLASVYPHDTKLRNVNLITRYVLSRVSPGAVLLLHDGTPDRIRTVAVLENILPELKKRGYRLVTLSELAALEEAPSPTAHKLHRP